MRRGCRFCGQELLLKDEIRQLPSAAASYVSRHEDPVCESQLAVSHPFCIQPELPWWSCGEPDTATGSIGVVDWQTAGIKFPLAGG